MSKPNGSPPKVKIPLDGGMNVSIFENWRDIPTGDRKKVYSISIQTRRFQDRDTGEWKSAKSFTPTEAAAVMWGIQKALDAVNAMQAEDAASTPQAEDAASTPQAQDQTAEIPF